MKYKSLIFFTLFVANICSAQRIHPEYTYELPGLLRESSGLQFYNSNFITHNDGDNESILFIIDKKGELKKCLKLNETKNVDWEDLTSDDSSFLYIADMGNNMNQRKDQVIYKLNPDKNEKPKEIKFQFSDQRSFPPSESNWNFDAEAIVWYNDSLFIFSKNNTKPFTGYSKMYVLPDVPGIYKVSARDSFSMGKLGFLQEAVTSATLSHDKKKLVLISCNKLWVFYDFQNSNFFKGHSAEFIFNNFTQKEAVAFDNKNNLYVTDEKTTSFLGGKMYFYKLWKYFNGEVPYTSQLISKVKISVKDKGHVNFHYSLSGSGTLEVNVYNEKDAIISTAKKEISKPSVAEELLPIALTQKDMSKAVVRVHLNGRMIYCNRMVKMMYD